MTVLFCFYLGWSFSEQMICSSFFSNAFEYMVFWDFIVTYSKTFQKFVGFEEDQFSLLNFISRRIWAFIIMTLVRTMGTRLYEIAMKSSFMFNFSGNKSGKYKLKLEVQ